MEFQRNKNYIINYTDGNFKTSVHLQHTLPILTGNK